jgi:hypothetical protein
VSRRTTVVGQSIRVAAMARNTTVHQAGGDGRYITEPGNRSAPTASQTSPSPSRRVGSDSTTAALGRSVPTATCRYPSPSTAAARGRPTTLSGTVSGLSMPKW